jgi:hypothetical protein
MEIEQKPPVILIRVYEDKGKFFGVVDVKSKFGGLTIN